MESCSADHQGPVEAAGSSYGKILYIHFFFSDFWVDPSLLLLRR
jgi:hypothetical protein